MTLHCKQGDMARMIKAHYPENIGLIVNVIRRCEDVPDHGAAWECKPAWPARQVFITSKTFCGWTNRLAAIPDAWLRPIRPEADPVTTEVVDEVSA